MPEAMVLPPLPWAHDAKDGDRFSFSKVVDDVVLKVIFTHIGSLAEDLVTNVGKPANAIKGFVQHTLIRVSLISAPGFGSVLKDVLDV